MQRDHAETALMLKGYGLLTVEFTYGIPDYPNVLNTLVLQDNDMAPHFPRLKALVRYWDKHIEGKLRLVRFTHEKLIRPNEWRNVKAEYLIN